MKKINILILIAFLFSACTDGYEELLKDPTTTSSVPTSTLLTGAMVDLMNNNSSLGFNKTTELYVQHWSQRETTVRSRYGDVESGWSTWYLGGLPELNNIIALNTGDKKENFTVFGSTVNQLAVANILKSWTFLNITDAYGDVPYFESGSRDFTFPTYDSQSAIYADLLIKLKAANDNIDIDGTALKGDIMYKGDMSKWKKLANSLRARIAMRMSKVDAVKAKSELASAIADGVFENNDDNAIISYQDEYKFSNPLFLEFDVQQWTFISRTLTNKMTQNGAISDPRLAIYASPNKNGNYVGLPYGLLDDESTLFAIDSCSYPGELVRKNTFPSIFMTYSEIQFILTEAAQEGWISGSAEDFYNEAITANMNFWGINDDDEKSPIADYLGQNSVVYNTANWKEQLGTQKWISFYTQGGQAWAEYRRIGFPVLDVPSGILENNATQVPRRFQYNLEEANLNAQKLEAAIQNMGGNTFNTRVWWDK